jgi:uracil phosphoribosyltransferase
LAIAKVIDHPLAGNFLRTLRDRDTGIKDFREAVHRLGLLLGVEVCRELKTERDSVITPLDVAAECRCVRDDRVMLVPVLRAGLGMVESFLTLLPSARVGHIGMYRDHETLEAKPYVNTLPDAIDEYERIIVLDPMLATGNSGAKALEFITAKGYQNEQILFVCMLATETGIKHINESFPGVKIYTAVIDPALNDKAYIVPGLGDAGDRLYLL